MKTKEKLKFWPWLFGPAHSLPALVLLGFIIFFLTNWANLAISTIGVLLPILGTLFFSGIFIFLCYKTYKHYKELKEDYDFQY